MVIRTAAQKTLATVEYITATKDGDYGPYRSVLFKRSDLQGDAAKVWRSLKPHEAEQFTKGQQVHLIPTERKGKQTWDIELLSPTAAKSSAPPATSPAASTTLAPEQKKAIAAYVEGQADLLAFCWQVAREKLPNKSEESHRCAASSLYIAAARKFDL